MEPAFVWTSTKNEWNAQNAIWSRAFGPSITGNLDTRVLTFWKHFDLRWLSPAIRNLWLLLVYLASQSVIIILLFSYDSYLPLRGVGRTQHSPLGWLQRSRTTHFTGFLKLNGKKVKSINKCIDYQIYSRKLLLYLQKLNEFHSRILFPNETSITNTTLKEDFSWFCFYSGKVVSDFYNLKPALARLAYFCRTRISSCYLWWLWSPSFITLLVYVGSLEELTVYHSNLYSGKQWLDASGAKKLRNDSQCEIIKHYAAKQLYFSLACPGIRAVVKRNIWRYGASGWSRENQKRKESETDYL